MSESYLSNPNLKAVGVPVAFTQEQVEEYQRCAADCDYFVQHYVKIVHVDRGLISFELFDFQRSIIRSFVQENKVIVRLPRQMGKCFDINTIITVKDTNTGIIDKMTIGEFYAQISKNTSISTTKKDSRTTETIYREGRGNRLRDMSLLSYDFNRPDISYQSNSQDFPERVCETSPPSFTELFTETIRTSEGEQESSISTWRSPLTLFQTLFEKGSRSSTHNTQSQKNQNAEQIQQYDVGILDEKNWRRCDCSQKTSDFTAEDFLFGKMYPEIWRNRRTKAVGRSSNKMDDQLQKAKLFQNFSRIIFRDYASVSVRSCIFCAMESRGYGRVPKQGISSSALFRQNSSPRFHRSHQKKNHRVRWAILARSKQSQSKKRERTRRSHNKKWVPIIENLGTGIQTEYIRNYSEMSPLSDRVTRKFVESFCLSNFEIWTDTGWKPISAVHKTVPYQEWILVTEKGKRLVCADTHIVFRENGKEVFVKDLLPDDVILTDAGVERVCSIQETSTYNHMYDVTVESEDHRFYTNGILSHNTTTTAAFFLWYILFHDDKVCAILANKAATAREILSRIKLAYEHLPLWLQQGVVEWNKGSIALENGSRVLAAATSSSGIRGYSLSLVFLDEFAHVHNNIAEEFFTSIFPTISSGKDTKILIASTPNGLNHFYKFWVDAEEKRNGFVPLYFSWNSHPDRDHEWMEKQLQVLGDVKFRQEVLCDFIGSSDTLISGAALSKLVYHVPLRTEQHLDVYEDPIDHHTYVITCDVSHGLDQDASAFSVFDVTTVPYKQVAKYHNATIPPLLLPTILSNVGNTYNRAFILVELNDVGTQVAESLHHDLEYENLFRTEGFQQRGVKVTAGFKRRVLMGLRMTEPVKRIGCSNLKTLVEREKIIIHDFATISELSTFTQQGNTYKADEGYHDDLAMTLVLFGWLASQKYFREANNTDIRQTLELENENTDWLSFGFQGAEPDVIEEITVEDQTIWIPIGKTVQDVLNDKFSIL